MSELTDAYMKGWSAGWNMALHAHKKQVITLMRERIKECETRDCEMCLATEELIETIRSTNDTK